MSWKKNQEHKKVLHIDSAEALSMSGVPNSAQHTCHPESFPHRREYSCSVEEPGKYEVIKDGTKLENCGSVEVEMRNGEVAVKYEKDGKVDWTPVMRRRKKSVRSKENDSSGNLNVMINLNKGRSLL